jgi:hypothetical protein
LVNRRGLRSTLVGGVLLAASLVWPPVAVGATGATDSTQLRANYDVRATLDYTAGSLAVVSLATVANVTSGPVGQLTFNLLPLRVGHAQVGTVTVARQPAAFRVADQSLIVALPFPLHPGATTTVSINYTATFARTAGDKNWLFAKQAGTLTAYRWIPWLSEAVPFARPNDGSPFVTAVSANVNVVLRSNVALRYATSGQPVSVSPDGLSQVFAATNVRDFNFVADPAYASLTGSVGPTTVIVVSRTLPAASLLYWAETALTFYEAKVGPYRYPTLTVAEIPAGTSMESPAMVWITADSVGFDLHYRVAHEIAHQWFYAMVGSNQATEPFADEAPADFMARTLLGAFRASRCAAQALDGTIWDYTNACYYEAIYIEGGDYLNAYSQAVGSNAVWAGLRAYYQRYLLGMGGTRALWDALDAASGYSGGHADRFPTLY